MWKFVLIGLLPLMLLAGFDWSTVDLEDSQRFVQSEIMVRFANEVNPDDALFALEEMNVVELSRFEQLNILHLKVPDGLKIREALEYYQARPDVVYAEPVAIMHAFWTPNDPNFGLQWHFDASHLNMPAAWDVQRGSSGVIIAIIDTGIAYKDCPIPSYEQDEVYSSDGNYHIAPDFNTSQFVPGYDFINNDTLPNDEQGHGTHVAGTVAQATNNNIGVAGMAHNCKLMPVRVLNDWGTGTAPPLVEGIIWAADHGADVINMSLGFGVDSIGLSSVHDAIIYAQNKGVVVVAATGNFAVLYPNQIVYPAAFEECIAVGALDYNNERAPYSQYGSGIDISASGGNTGADENNDGYADGVLQNAFVQFGSETQYATVDEFTYLFLDGTSMATPHVAGLAALLISHGITTVDSVKQAIYSTATDLGSSGYDTYYGYGMINPVAALGGGSSGDVEIEIPVLQNPLLSQYIDIWVVPTSGDIYSAPDVTVTLDGSEEAVSMQAVSGTRNYVGDYQFSSEGTATIEVTAGETAESRTFSVNAIGVAGGMGASPDGRLRLLIPEGSIPTSTYFTILPEKTTASVSSNPYAVLAVKDAAQVGPAYRIGPAGAALDNPASIRISYSARELAGADPATLAIMRYENGTWSKVSSFIDRENSQVVASVQKLGIFQLASDPCQVSPDLPGAVQLELASNPFGNQPVLLLALAEETHLTLEVFDASGRRIATLARGSFPAGEHEIGWDDDSQPSPSGVYFFRLKTPTHAQTLKLICVH
jgi:serine protease